MLDRSARHRHGHAVVWQKEWYQVFRFAEQEHADWFMQEVGGEPMHPSERGKGKRWAQWKKGRISRNSEARMTSAGGQCWFASLGFQQIHYRVIQLPVVNDPDELVERSSAFRGPGSRKSTITTCASSNTFSIRSAGVMYATPLIAIQDRRRVFVPAG